jgi:SEC-C motif-containing protein
MSGCPCHSGKSYQDCCEPYLTQAQTAPTPEALMRSRYTAHVLVNVDHLKRTCRGTAAAKFKRADSFRFAKESEWLGLDIVRAYMLSPTKGVVEFVAHYNDAKGRHDHVQEASEFLLEEGQWYYVGGKSFEHHAHHHPVAEPIRHSAPKIGRNDPCSCGSGKKFKKCCG